MGNVVLDYSQIFEKVSTLTQLRAYSVIGVKTGDPLLVVGTTAPADGGGGLYVWDALSRAPDNNTSVIKPNSILNEGRWVAITLPMALPPIPPPPPVKYSVPFGFTFINVQMAAASYDWPHLSCTWRTKQSRHWQAYSISGS